MLVLLSLLAWSSFGAEVASLKELAFVDDMIRVRSDASSCLSSFLTRAAAESSTALLLSSPLLSSPPSPAQGA